ncbi:hypothetical protein B0T22DRAFT_217504 [Podospora appendiculata]|uniref:Uncharacterized protein n=1 Tax=Podospora appendiculata TaxID=314037 RepID=A0AAE0X578_9PEZI|nr:hypothetical protein B0T22DRAFT_217504 [Podospora appendiculata]
MSFFFPTCSKGDVLYLCWLSRCGGLEVRQSRSLSRDNQSAMQRDGNIASAHRRGKKGNRGWVDVMQGHMREKDGGSAVCVVFHHSLIISLMLLHVSKRGRVGNLCVTYHSCLSGQGSHYSVSLSHTHTRAHTQAYYLFLSLNPSVPQSLSPSVPQSLSLSDCAVVHCVQIVLGFPIPRHISILAVWRWILPSQQEMPRVVTRKEECAAGSRQQQ